MTFYLFLAYFGAGFGYVSSLFLSEWHERVSWGAGVVADVMEIDEPVYTYGFPLVLAFVYSFRFLFWPYYVIRGETDEGEELRVAYYHYKNGEEDRARGIIRQQVENSQKS